MDGWPQISDAVVDYYYHKKLAYHYIKRSQQPVCLMFDEPENGEIRLVAVNDLPADQKISYSVRRFSNDKIVLAGEAVIGADSAQSVASLKIAENEKEFYDIQWTIGKEICYNHYMTNILDIDYQTYLNALKECNMDEFEGF